MTDRQPAGVGLLRRITSTLLALVVALAIFWGVGLLWFVHIIPNDIVDPDSKTDAIVVLTGGSRRVQQGLELLAAGKAQKLFVSGVSRNVHIPALLHAAGQPGERDECCIILGYAADNTLGNAHETDIWMRDEGFHSLRLVTASYHMPRSLLEFRRAMPDIKVIAHPVFPENVKQDRWWAWPGTASLIVGEYDKYLLALVRPILPERLIPRGTAE
jgi:uncharacterized SAM-binding protein YcdF (DUF218 family)